MTNNETKSQKISFFDRMLNWIERFGNKMMDPITLFVVLCVIIVLVSAITCKAGVSVVHPGTKEIITPKNLLTVEGARRMWSGAVKNFQNFPPFGMVIVAMMGVGLAEKTGLLRVTMRRTLKNVPKNLVTFIIILVGVICNVAGDAGFVVLPPLAAMIFYGIGRHPLIGLFAAYASVAGGFAATIFLALGDVLTYGFTLPAAQMVDPNYIGSPAMNYYFMCASTIVLAITGTIVTEKIIAPRFKEFNSEDMTIKEDNVDFNDPLTPTENRALKTAGIAIIACVIGLIALSVGPNAMLADPKTGSLLTGGAPFMSGIIVTVTLLFFIPAAVYGFSTGQLKSDKDLVATIGEALKDMGPYILLAFVCSQFTAYFSWSDLGIIIAIKGSEFLTNIGITGTGLLVGFIIISSIINIFIGSASAKWAIMAPVFIPMLMFMGFNPAVTQMAYRIGDSITNPISPLFPYFPILLGFVRKYDKKAGMGTVIANMVPYSLIFGIVWILFFVIYVSTGLPLGPNGSVFYSIPK